MSYRLGVDLGTTFTSAAVATNGRVEVVPLGDHSNEIPSVVYLAPDGDFRVGEAAVAREIEHPDRVAREFKRRLGDSTGMLLGGVPISAHTLTAKLLASVLETVTERQGAAPDQIVVTCPANWGPYRREVLGHALELAEVPQATLCTEPEAAALHFAAANRLRDGDVVAVYDLGGGTFDSAVLRRNGDEFVLVGKPEGIEQLGGLDFDAAVVGRVWSQLGIEPNDDPLTNRGILQLRDQCVLAKERLSRDVEATIPVSIPGAPASVRLTRMELEELIAPLVEQTVDCLERALRRAEVGANDLAGVLLVGGSARIPLVSERLTRRLGRPLPPSPQPKLCVALGATLFGSEPTAQEPSMPATSGHGGRPDAAGGAPARTVVDTTSVQAIEDPTLIKQPPGAATPRDPRVFVYATAAAALLVLGLLAVFVGQAAPSPSQALPWVRGSSTVVVPDRPARTAQVALSVFGVPIPQTPVKVPADGAGFSLGTSQRSFLTGPVEAEFLDSGGNPAGDTEPVHLVPVNERWWDPLATVPGALLVLGALYAIAYGESILRGMRRHRGTVRTGELVGMTGVGAILGGVVALASWGTGRAPVGATTGLAVVCLAAAGGLLAFAVASAAASRAP